MQKIIETIEKYIASGKLVKMTLSKVRRKSQEVRNIYVRPVIIKDKLYFSFTYRTASQDSVKNLPPQDVPDKIRLYLTELFFNADVFSKNVQYTFVQNKKGNNRISSKPFKSEGNANTDHNRSKKRLIPENTPYLIDLKITSAKGKVYENAQKKYRQINRYVEILDNLLKKEKEKEKKRFHISDMGSGKGYLSFALYDHLRGNRKFDVALTGYEIRPDLVHTCNRISAKNDMEGLQFVQGDIINTDIEETDMVIALHACDIATDMAIYKGISTNAKYIVTAPCCHKQIRKEMQRRQENSLKPILNHGIMLERQAEMITDGIRALLMESKGYKTQIFEFISSEHTNKNIMITAVKDKVNPNALQQIESIKKDFGIREHYLEKLLNG